MIFGEHAKCQAEAEYPELWRGLVGAWSPCLSPRGGTVLRDLSGRGNHGTLTNMDPATDWVNSGGKTALDFDGSNDYVALSASESLNRLSIGVIKIWVYENGSTPPLAYLTYCKISDGAASNILYIEKRTVSLDVRFLVRGGVEVYTPANTLVNNKWSCLHFVMTASGISVYSNGESIPTSSLTFNVGTSSTRAFFTEVSGADLFNFGRLLPSAPRYFSGVLGEVCIYSQPFTASMVKFDYSLGQGGWATPRRRRWNYATAQTAIPYWVFARKNARLIGGGVT